MTVTAKPKPAGALAAIALGSLASLLASSPAQASIVTFTTFSNSPDAVNSVSDYIFGTDGAQASGLTVSGPTFTFQDSGIQVTFSNPTNPDGGAVSRSISNPSLGTCVGGRRPATVAICGNKPGELAVPPSDRAELNQITLTFNKQVKLISTAGNMRSIGGDSLVDNKITSIWQTIGSSASFDYTNPVITGSIDPYYSAYSSSFDNFIVQANTPVTITTNFMQGNMDYWMQELNVVEVPGPLPLLGVGSAFAFSRRIRRRSKTVRRIELV